MWGRIALPRLSVMVFRNSVSILSGLGVLSAAVYAVAPATLNAQSMVSQPVVQALPPPEVQRLNQALLELAKRPESLPALIEAGDAAVEVGDLDAALGFYGRAREVDADNGQAMLGLAKVYLRSGRPTTALPLFDAARDAGAGLYSIDSDRALALDMVGDQAAAQSSYAVVLQADPDNKEARRRLAVSYAISGNAAAFETTLRPLIDRRDFAAFRARAFGLAILGEQERAAAITDAVMPRDLSAKITPYLEFMPRLTPAQQAAAANLGIFPRAADIGRDSPQIAAFNGAPDEPASGTAQPSSIDRQLEPTGKPLGAEQASDDVAPPQNPVPEQLSPSSESARVADAFDDMADVEAAEEVAQAAQGAVDIAAIEVPREAPPGPEPEQPEHPSRIWVQLATGKDLKALGFDWRRFARKAPEMLSEYEAHTVPSGKAHRL